MQPQYMRAILELSPDAKYALERAFSLPRRGSLYFRLRNIDQAQVVLALMRAGLWTDVTRMVGHTVPVICPPCLSKLGAPVMRLERTLDEERVVIWKTKDSPRIVSTMLQRFQLVRPGLTVAQLLLRGVTRRDLREWIAEGSIKVERKQFKEIQVC